MTPAEHHATYEPSAHPGCLAPHAWLADVSLYDRLGPGYTLLVLDGAAAETARAIADAADAAGVPLHVLELEDAGLRDLYVAPLALVRPDQYVAWRGASADPAFLVETIRGAALAKAESTFERKAS